MLCPNVFSYYSYLDVLTFAIMIMQNSNEISLMVNEYCNGGLILE